MRKKRTIKEAITYTPEKVDEFVKQASKDLEDAKRILEVMHNKVTALSIGDALDNPESIEALKNQTDKAYNGVDKVHTKYFNIVNMYDTGETPENVEQLDKIVDELGDYSHKLMKLDTAVEDLIEVAEKLQGTR